MLLVAMPGAPSSVRSLLVVRPGAPIVASCLFCYFHCKLFIVILRGVVAESVLSKSS